MEDEVTTFGMPASMRTEKCTMVHQCIVIGALLLLFALLGALSWLSRDDPWPNQPVPRVIEESPPAS